MRAQPNATTKKCFFALTLSLLIVHISATPVCAKDIIQIGGTGTGIGVMKLLGSAYEKKHSDVHIEVLPSMGTDGGIKAALDGAVGLALAGRTLNDGELKAGAVAVEIARTPFVFVTHKKTPKSGLTMEELVNIFSLRTTTWPDGERIRLVLRPARETSSVILKAISPDMNRAMALALAKEGMIFAATDQDSAEAVAKTPGSLGTSTLTQIITERLPIKILKLDGQTPNVTSLADGSYKLYKSLFIITTSRTTSAARRFAEYISSAEARAIIKKAGNISSPF